MRSYGFALALGFAIGIGFAYGRARRRGLRAVVALEVGIVAIVSALLGARLFHLGLHPEEVQAAGGWLAALVPPPRADQAGTVFGLSVMGGLPAAVVAVITLIRLRGEPLWTWIDLLAPSVALGAAITRIGCFGNGCCFGWPTALPWGVSFPPGSLPHHHLGAVALHPTQLYQSLVALAIAIGLLALERRVRTRGVVFAAFLAAMGLQRLLFEALRFHDAAERWRSIGGMEITIYQGVAAGIVLAGAATGVIQWRRERGLAPK